jgi:hypothetical protein
MLQKQNRVFWLKSFRDPGSSAFWPLDPGSEIEKSFDPGSGLYFLELSNNFLGYKLCREGFL